MSVIVVICLAMLLFWRYSTLTRVGVRLTLGFALIILLLASVVINGINEMDSLSSQTVMIQKHPLTVSNAVLRVNNNIIKIHRSMKDIALARDITEIEKSARIVESLEEEAYRDFKIINERFLGDKELVRDAERVFKTWKPIRDEVISLMHAGRYREAAGITKGKGALHVVKIEKAMEALGDFARAKSDELLRISEQIKSRAFNTMYLLFVITLGTGIIVSIFITRSITRPIVTMKDAMLKIGEGELDRTVEIKSADEIGQLAESLNKMTANLKKITASRDELNEEITERKRVEDALRNSEKFLNSVLDGIQDGISVVDKNSNILHTNSALKQFYPESQSPDGRKCYEVYQGRTEPCEDCPTLKPFRTGTIHSDTVHLSGSGGKPKCVEITAFPIKGENNSVSAVIKNFRDITERKRFEEALRESENQLSDIINAIPALTAYVDSEMRYRFVNKTWEEWHCRPRTDVEGRLVSEVVSKKIYEQIKPNIDKVLSGSPTYFENKAYYKCGTVFHIKASYKPDFDKNNNVKGFYALVVDISERKRAEEALQKSERKYRQLIELAQEGIWVIDEHSKTSLVNKSMAKMLGYDERDMMGRHLFEFMDEHGVVICKRNLERRKEGKKEQHDFEFIRKDGKRIHTTMETSPINDESGNYIGAIAGVIDITERKRAEEELQSAKQLLDKTFNSLNEVVLVVNPDSRAIIAVNPAVERLFGYSKEELIGRSTEIVHVDRSSYEEFGKKVFAELEQSGVYRSEYRMRKRDGTIFLCDSTITEIRDESGKRTELVGVFADITEKRLVEQELLKTQRLESLSLLAGGIAHDFNNILMGILGNISLAKFLNRSEKKPLKVLEEAEKAAIRARGLTNQLLTFSTGGAPLKNAAKINDLVTEVSQFALRGSKSKAVNKLDKNLATVNVDRDQITQVINNLLINADQAMPEGGTITLRGENITLTDDEEYNLPGGQYVKISVEDNGVGIPPNIIDIIFDPFFTTKIDGSGLGLSTSYSIIRNHGGLLKVISRLGEGSTFHVYLPAAEKPVPRKSRDKIYTNGIGKILVMDDDELVRNVLAEMLSVLGYQSELVRDGEEAEKKYTEAMQTGEHYAAVILDLTVRGGMGGKQAMEKLKAIDPNVNAIVASGYSTDIVLEDYGRFGFSGYVTKPFELKTLSKVLSKTIRASG